MLSRSVIVAKSSAAVRRLSTRAATAAWSTSDVQLKPEEVRNLFRSMAMEDDEKHSELVYGLSFAHDQAADEAAWKFSVLTDPLMQTQLRESQHQLTRSLSSSSSSQQQRQHLEQNSNNHATTTTTTPLDTAPLPKTLDAALRCHSRRAIVVTETTAPFRIVNVNAAWQDLCGYTFVESQGQSLGRLLQGPETDQAAATALIAKLLQGEPEAGTQLVNYTKEGRRFCNRVRVGPLYRDETEQEVTHFVGVLQEIGP